MIPLKKILTSNIHVSTCINQTTPLFIHCTERKRKWKRGCHNKGFRRKKNSFKCVSSWFLAIQCMFKPFIQAYITFFLFSANVEAGVAFSDPKTAKIPSLAGFSVLVCLQSCWTSFRPWYLMLKLSPNPHNT